MDNTMVEKLIKGVGVMIDDDADTVGTAANIMLTSIQNNGIPMVVYTDIPDTSVIDSLGSISFIVLDWDFTPSGQSFPELGEVQMGSEFQKEQKRTILEFMKTLLKRIFVPVFLITGQDFSRVREELVEEGIYSDEDPCRIMLKDKTEVKDYRTLFKSIKQWMDTMPSAHVLKLWEKEAVQAKNRMFLDLYNASPEWVMVLLDVLKEDSGNNKKAVNHDFREMLCNNFINRMHDSSFLDVSKTRNTESTADEIRRVLQGERYIAYDEADLPDVSYVGDLYKIKGKEEYLVNIRAQCDLIREDDPDLYLIPGIELELSNIAMNPRIKLKSDNKKLVLVIDQKEYLLEEMINYKKQNKGQFNSDMQRFDRLLLFDKGQIIEKKTHAILPCVAEKLFIEFQFKRFLIKKKSTLEAEAMRVGRIIPPYITKIQNLFASYMVREGVMPIPEKLIQ